MEQEYGKVQRLINRHKLPFAIFCAILIALALTLISMYLYIKSGTSSLDLSRPGYTAVRDQVIDQPAESFDETGPLDGKTVGEFKKLFDAQRKTINSLGDFDDTSLSDESLQLQAQ